MQYGLLRTQFLNNLHVYAVCRLHCPVPCPSLSIYRPCRVLTYFNTLSIKHLASHTFFMHIVILTAIAEIEIHTVLPCSAFKKNSETGLNQNAQKSNSALRCHLYYVHFIALVQTVIRVLWGKICVWISGTTTTVPLIQPLGYSNQFCVCWSEVAKVCCICEADYVCGLITAINPNLPVSNFYAL